MRNRLRKQCLSTLGLYFYSENGKHQIPLQSIRQYGIIICNTVICIITATGISNLLVINLLMLKLQELVQLWKSSTIGEKQLQIV
jgi:hypothetical protein